MSKTLETRLTALEDTVRDLSMINITFRMIVNQELGLYSGAKTKLFMELFEGSLQQYNSVYGANLHVNKGAAGQYEADALDEKKRARMKAAWSEAFKSQHIRAEVDQLKKRVSELEKLLEGVEGDGKNRIVS